MASSWSVNSKVCTLRDMITPRRRLGSLGTSGEGSDSCKQDNDLKAHAKPRSVREKRAASLCFPDAQ